MRRIVFSIAFFQKKLPVQSTSTSTKSRWKFYTQVGHRSFHTAWVESRCGAVALGRTYLLPPLSSGGASMVPPWFRFHIPLVEPDRQISRIRLVWGFLCQGGVTPFWSSFAFHSFVRPAPRAFFRPDRIFPSPSRAAAVKDGASSAPPKACP